MKLLVLGFDGLDHEYARAVIPPKYNIYPLRSQVGLTGCEWTSMWTGIPVETLGLYNFYPHSDALARGVPRRFSYSNLEGYFWWEIAMAAGISTGVCGVPACAPLREPENGWILGGVGSLDENASHLVRTGLDTQVQADYVMGDEALYVHPLIAHCKYWGFMGRWYDLILSMGYETFFRWMQGHAFRKIHFMTLGPTDVGCLYFRFFDHMIHHYLASFNENPEPVFEAGRAIIKQAVKMLQPEAVIIMSDHGGRIGARHRDTGIVATWPSAPSPLPESDSGYSVDYTIAKSYEWMDFVTAIEGPYVPGTADVASIILSELGLEPKPPPPALGETYDEDDMEQVEKRLKDLGYI